MVTFIPRASRPLWLLAVLDTAVLAAVAWLAHCVRFQEAVRTAKWRELVGHPGLIAVAVVTLLGLAVSAELYQPLALRRPREIVLRVGAVGTVWGAAIALATYTVPTWRFGRGLLLITTTAWIAAAMLIRLAGSRRRNHRQRFPALVVGGPQPVAGVCARLAAHPLSPWEPIDGSEMPAGAVADAIHQRRAHVVILAGGDEETAAASADELAALQFAGVPVVVASEVWAWLDGRLPVAELSPAAFLHQPGFGAVHWELFNRLTRVFDVVVGGVLFVVTLPLHLLAAAAVLLLNGRPVYYRQVRLGQFGRPFEILKLRTMHPDAERDGPAFAARKDPRVTRLGRVLRRVRLDELPQLLNVLRGDMALVGPRPERPEFTAELSRSIPYYAFRLAVPPGLTGWAQVHVRYARTVDEHRRKLEYDLYFIRERSFGLYLLTLLRTVSVALVGAPR